MNDPASHHSHRSHGPTVVIVVDDPTQLPADLASLVGHLQHFAWPNGPPSIQVVAASPPPNPGSPFIERRKRTTDRRQSTRVLASGVSASVSADTSPPQALPDQPAIDERHSCTDREREIVELLRHGLTNKQIAHQLGIMEETVKKHLQHIYDKFGVRRRALVMLGRVGARTHIDRNPAFP
jgi:DNA-binding CsgD family transcriptional regulator